MDEILRLGRYPFPYPDYPHTIYPPCAFLFYLLKKHKIKMATLFKSIGFTYLHSRWGIGLEKMDEKKAKNSPRKTKWVYGFSLETDLKLCHFFGLPRGFFSHISVEYESFLEFNYMRDKGLFKSMITLKEVKELGLEDWLHDPRGRRVKPKKIRINFKKKKSIFKC